MRVYVNGGTRYSLVTVCDGIKNIGHYKHNQYYYCIQNIKVIIDSEINATSYGVRNEKKKIVSMLLTRKYPDNKTDSIIISPVFSVFKSKSKENIRVVNREKCLLHNERTIKEFVSRYWQHLQFI